MNINSILSIDKLQQLKNSRYSETSNIEITNVYSGDRLFVLQEIEFVPGETD
jgi:hypothetical protein